MGWDELLTRARRGEGPLRHARTLWRAALGVRLPVVRPLVAALYAERGFRQTVVPLVLKVLYREPLLRYRCARVGERLNLEGEIPLIYGAGRIEIGDDVRLGRRQTWIVGFKNSTTAELAIGDRTEVNYGCVISAATSVRIGSDVLIASGVQIYDNPSHPLSPAARRRRESFAIEDAKPVVIGDNVWIAAGALILRGVTIGDNSVVGAGAVVTKSVPPNVLVAGSPAHVVKDISDRADRLPADALVADAAAPIARPS